MALSSLKGTEDTRKNQAKKALLAGGFGAAVTVVSALPLDMFEGRLALRLGVLIAGSVPLAYALYAQIMRGGQRLPAGILAVHIIALLFFFPPADLVNNKPVVTHDHSFHYYQVYRSSETFWETMRIDRYDPYFMAGYPGGTLFDLDMKAAQLFCAMLPALGVARGLKLFILLCYIAVVFTLYYGGRWQGLSHNQAVLGMLLFLAVWHWGRPYFGDFRFSGMFSYLLMIQLAFLLLGLVRQFLRGHYYWLFVVVGLLAFLVHPAAIVLLPAPFLVILALDRHLLTRRKLLLLAVWCVAVVATNSVWLGTFFQFISQKTESNTYFQIHGLSGLFRLMVKPTGIPTLVFIALALAGVWRSWKLGRHGLSLPGLVGAIVLFVVAAAGIYVPYLDQLEPGRFVLGALVFLVVPAAVGVEWSLAVLLRPVRPLLIMGLCVLMLPLALLEAKAFYRHTITTELSPRVLQTVAAVKAEVAPTARLMIEETRSNEYYGTFLPAMLPLETGVEQIGGPYPDTFLEHHFTTFMAERTFGRPIGEWNADDFARYLDLYNVGWVLTCTRESAAAIGRLVAGTVVWEQGKYTLWKLGRKHTFTDPPGPRVQAHTNRIFISNLSGVESALIAYHWIPGLSVSPPSRLAPELVLDDPVPFIRIFPNGAGAVTLTY